MNARAIVGSRQFVEVELGDDRLPVLGLDTLHAALSREGLALSRDTAEGVFVAPSIHGRVRLTAMALEMPSAASLLERAEQTLQRIAASIP